MIIATSAIVAVIYAIFQVEQSKSNAKIDIVTSATNRMSVSFDKETGIILKLLEENSEKENAIRSMVNYEAFKVDKNSIYSILSDEDGEVSRKNSNKIRFNIVRLLNLWENQSILYMTAHGDCNVLYENNVGTLVKNHSFYKRFDQFIKIFDKTTGSHGTAWNNFIKLNKNIQIYCLNKSVEIACLQKVNIKDCDKGSTLRDR
jgi:hypothetical protein